MKLKVIRVIQNETPKMEKMSASTNKLSRFFAENAINMLDNQYNDIALNF